jgi:hypothetical protein
VAAAQKIMLENDFAGKIRITPVVRLKLAERVPGCRRRFKI